MKKVITCIGGLALTCLVATPVFAGAIDNKTNWSAEYIRTLNRNAATDYADIAAYNPAGTVKLQEGFTLNASVQYIDKDYANNITLGPGTTWEFESDEPSFIPGLFAVYNKNSFSVFGYATNVGGGGKVNFNAGNASTLGIAGGAAGMGIPLCPFSNDPVNPLSGTACDDFDIFGQKLNAESLYLAYSLGAAIKVFDIFSLSAGVRYVDAHKEVEASVILYEGTNAFPTSVSFEQDGEGWGGIFGINVAPTDKVNIGMRYETKTNLDFEASVPFGPGTVLLMDPNLNIINGQENPRDLPAIFAVGISFWLTPQLRIETNYTHYFNSDADWEGAEDAVDDGYDVGIALEYHFSDTLLFSIGYLKTETGIEPSDMLPESPELDANTFGIGLAHAISENLHTNVGVGYATYEDDSFIAPGPIPIEYEKRNLFVAMGLEYRF